MRDEFELTVSVIADLTEALRRESVPGIRSEIVQAIAAIEIARLEALVDLEGEEDEEVTVTSNWPGEALSPGGQDDVEEYEAWGLVEQDGKLWTRPILERADIFWDRRAITEAGQDPDEYRRVCVTVRLLPEGPTPTK